MTETSTTSSAPTRQFEGHILPAAGRWEIDPGTPTWPSPAGTSWSPRSAAGSPTSAARVDIAEDFDDSQGGGRASAWPVSSREHQTRDDHLRSADLFDVDQFPEATFRSTRVQWQGRGGIVTGDLTIHGVTRSVDLDVVFEGYVRDPWGGDRAIFSATTEVNREDFGVTWNVALEAGGVLVSKDIKITIDIETVLAG